MNRILRLLVLSDLFMMSGLGLIQPIFAIFIIKQINGASLTAVGIATAIQLLTRAVFQILVGEWADKEKGNKREVYALVAGSLLISVVPLGYVVAKTLAFLYFIQFMYGLGQALSFPTWRVIFSSYTERGRAGYEWGVYDTVVSLGTAASAALGAYSAERFSFNVVFIVVSIASLLGSLSFIQVYLNEISKKNRHT